MLTIHTLLNSLPSAAGKVGRSAIKALATLTGKLPDKTTHSTDVLYLSSFVSEIGATIAAYRIHCGLRREGVDSKMLVMGSELSERQNTTNKVYVAKPMYGEYFGLKSDMLPLRAYKHFVWFATGTGGLDISRYINELQPRIIQLHFINYGFLKIEDIGRIDRKIVWRLPDCWPFTGGCYYFRDCDRYKQECGKCPKLRSQDPYDLSHYIWLRKARAFEKLDMTIVVPTMWMKKVAAESSLFKGRRIEVIPNGLNTSEYFPLDKAHARRLLGLPGDKKIILYGAARAITDPRKGFHLLKEALESLQKIHAQEYLLVIFGAKEQPLGLDIEVKFEGYVKDTSKLRVIYSAADVMVVPSLEEAFGQTVIESMACATSVVTFRDTGPESIVEHKKTGYLANFADAAGLAKGIEWVLDGKERSLNMGLRARQKVETTYDIRIVARQYKKLYKSILK